MQRIDIATMYVTGAALLLVLTAQFWFYGRKLGRHPGASFWVLSAGLGAAGHLLFGISSVLAVQVVGTVLILAGAESLRVGLVRFLGLSERRLTWLAFFAGAAAAYFAFLLWVPNTAARVFIIGLVRASVYGGAAALCFGLRSGPMRNEGLLTGAALGAGALAALARSVFAASTFLGPDTAVPARGGPEALAMMASLVLYIFTLLTLPLLQARRARMDLEEALQRVRLLEGIVPICMFCKRIRDEHQEWHQVEKYISERSHAKFSHGLCSGCVHKLE